MSKKRNDNLIDQSIRDILLLEYTYEPKLLTKEETPHYALKGYELIIQTAHMGTELSSFYQAMVFVNYEEKRCIIANSGSRYAPLKSMFIDLFDGLRFFFGCFPYNVFEVIKVNDILLDSLGAEAINYEFHYTGHSIGAIVAECGATNMKKNLATLNMKSSNNQVTAITFENPGAKSLVDKFYCNYNVNENDNNNQFITFNNRKNFINSLGTSLGKIYTIKPDDQKPYLLTYKSWIFNKLKDWSSKISVFSTFTKLLQLGEMGILKLQEEHALECFKKVIMGQKGGCIDSDTGKVITLAEMSEEYSIDCTGCQNNSDF